MSIININQYPKNQIYCIMKVKDSKNNISAKLEFARKSLDGNFIVWNFEKDSIKLISLQSNCDIQFKSHKDCLTLMDSNSWSSKEVVE